MSLEPQGVKENSPEAVIPSPPPHLTRSLISLIAGILVLRAAAGAMGQNIQFYFNAIHDAALNPDSPLRHIVGAAHVYPISYTLGGIIIATFFASELLGSLVFGAWSDRYGRKLFIIFGPLFGAVAVQITALTTAVWMLVITRLLEGLSTASNAPATLSYMAENTSHSATLRTRLSGFFEIATIGGIALGSVIGGWLWQNFGTAAIVIGIPLTSPAFALNALIYLASLVILWLGIHELKEQRRAPQAAVGAGETVKRYWKIVSSPRVAGFVPAWIAINGVMGIWMNMTVRILTDKNSFPGQLLAGHFNSQQAGDLFALFMVCFVSGIFVWSYFFPQVKKTTAMLIGTGGLFVTCLMLFLINLQPALNAPLLIPLCALMVIGIMVLSGFTPAALAHLADITEAHTADRGAIMGLYSVFLGLGQFLGTLVGGPFVDKWGANGMVLACVLLGAIAAYLLLRLRNTEKDMV